MHTTAIPASARASARVPSAVGASPVRASPVAPSPVAAATSPPSARSTASTADGLAKATTSTPAARSARTCSAGGGVTTVRYASTRVTRAPSAVNSSSRVGAAPEAAGKSTHAPANGKVAATWSARPRAPGPRPSTATVQPAPAAARAVAGPTTATRGAGARPGAAAGLPAAAGAARPSPVAATARALVNTTQSNRSRRASAAFNGPGSRGGGYSDVGHDNTSAPSASSNARSRSSCEAPRVVTTRTPASGAATGTESPMRPIAPYPRVESSYPSVSSHSSGLAKIPVCSGASLRV